jgi:trimeric autotransporter adhesin
VRGCGDDVNVPPAAAAVPDPSVRWPYPHAMRFLSGRGGSALALTVVISLLASTAAASYPIDTDTRWSDEPRTDWGVTGSAPVSDAFRFDSPVFAVERVRGRIFVAGRFTEVTNGDRRVPRAFIAAFDARSGRWISSWTPELDGAVFALAAAPDGSALFVGGEFARVNGERRPALVALDPRTGATVDRFATRIRPAETTIPPRVHALEVAGNRLYIGGRFGQVRAKRTVAEASGAARVRWRTGRPDAAWAPSIEGGAVWAIGVAPKRDRIYLGGLFDEVDGRPRSAFAVVGDDARLDRSVPGRFGARFFGDPAGFDHVAAIEVTRSKVFVAGQNGRLVVARSRDLRVEHIHRTGRFGSDDGRGGDFQTLSRQGRLIFAGCHCWGRLRSVHEGRRTIADVDSVLAFDARSGRHVRSYRPQLRGREGAWGVAAAADGCLWIGGQISRSGDTAVENLVRSCPR